MFEGVHIISWSGGHDSTVMLHYLLNNDLKDESNVKILHIDTTMTLPQSEEYLDTIIKLWGLEDKLDVISHHEDFWTLLRRYKYWPSITKHWCRVIFKTRVAKKYYKNLKKKGYYPIYVYLGTSIHDSAHRRERYDVDERVNHITPRQDLPLSIQVIERFPIRLWDDAKKSAYMEKHDIPRNSAYELFGVSGCIFCPFYHEPYYRLLKLHEPELFQKLVNFEEETGKRIDPEFSIASIAVEQTLDDFK